MTRIIIIGVLWGMASFAVAQRNENIEKKYQCSIGLVSDVASVAFAPVIFALALVADNERVAPPDVCKVEDER